MLLKISFDNFIAAFQRLISYYNDKSDFIEEQIILKHPV